MKFALSILFLLTAVLTTTRADISYTQVLEIGDDPDLEDADMMVRSSGPMVRVDVGKSITTITNNTKGTTSTVLHEERMYFDVAAPIKDFTALTIASPEGAEKGKLTGTGPDEEISGYKCTSHTFEKGGKVLTVWLTQDEPKSVEFTKRITALGTDLDPFQGNLVGLPLPEGFPVRVKVVNEKGEHSTMTLKSVSDLPITGDVFAIPFGYESLKSSKSKKLK